MADEQTLNHIMNEYEELRISEANERKKRIEEVNKKMGLSGKQIGIGIFIACFLNVWPAIIL